MDTDSQMWTGIIIGIIFLILKGIVTACETAVVELNDSKVKKKAETNKKAKKLLKLLEKPTKLLVSISTFKTMSAAVVAFIATLTFYTKIQNTFDFINNVIIENIICVFILVFAVTLLIVVFGESIPKRIARAHTEKFAYKTIGFLRLIVFIFSPVSKLISGFSFIISKLLGIDSKALKEAVTEEEILMMVDAGNETGTIEESQREMINNIFEFDDLMVSDVMTHRTQMVACEKDISIKELVSTVVNEGFSRIPVYENSIDNIVGVVYAKDLLNLIGINEIETNSISEFVRDVLYVPETSHCAELFKEFTSRKSQIAVAVDEYGGTAGIVSMEDLLESIVGNIQDEYDDEKEEITKISDTEYEILGRANPDIVMEELKLELEQDNNYETMSGFIIDLLGNIPKDGETPETTYKNVTFKVLHTEENRIIKIKVKINYQPEDIN